MAAVAHHDIQRRNQSSVQVYDAVTLTALCVSVLTQTSQRQTGRWVWILSEVAEDKKALSSN